MTPLTMTQTAATAQRLDMRQFTPERLAALSLDEIRRLPIHVGNRCHALGDYFELSGEPGPQLVIVPMTANLDFIGAGMTSGDLQVAGEAGDGTGQAMSGGTLRVHGSTGDAAGAGMTGGLLRIAGNAGERLGGPLVGATQGMDRGVIQICGSAGDRAGERMRRGLILIQGDAGGWCGVNMTAGTIVVQGNTGPMAGSGMRRGTLLLSRKPAGLPQTFNDNGVQDLSFIVLLLGELAGLTGNPDGRLSADSAWPMRRYLGDLGDGGKGEILWPEEA